MSTHSLKPSNVALQGSMEAATAVANTVVASGPTAIRILGKSLSDGCIINVHAAGRVSTTGTPTLDIGLYNGSTALIAFAQITCTNNTASAPFSAQFTGVVRSLGALGTILWTGRMDAEDANLDVGIADSTADTVDTNSAIDLSILATWSAASASNSIVFEQFYVELKGV